MKLEVGMYVRTKWGYICELININDFREPSMRYGVEASYLKDVMFIGDEDILKASHNIIDLIEVGDIIKFEYDGTEYVCDVYAYKGDEEDLAVACENISIHIKENNSRFELISIVTKEQFESMEYKVL